MNPLTPGPLAALTAMAIAATAAIPGATATRGQDASEPHRSAPVRLLAWDDKSSTLHAFDAESGKELHSVQVPAGDLLWPSDPTRLVAIWRNGRTGEDHAVVLERSSLRRIGEARLGRYCNRIFEASDRRHLVTVCHEYPKPKDPGIGRLVSVDLDSGTLAGATTVAYGTYVIEAGGRLLALPFDAGSVADSEHVLVVDPMDPERSARIPAPCMADPTYAFADREGRRLFLRCRLPGADAAAASPARSAMFVMDLQSPDSPRSIALDAQFVPTWGFTDGRFAYMANTNTGMGTPPPGEPRLLIFSAEKEMIVGRVPLAGDSTEVSYGSRASGEAPRPTPFFVRAGERLLVVGDGRLLGEVPLPGKEPFLALVYGPGRKRVYVKRDKVLVALDLPDGRLAWTTTASGSLSVAPDGRRGLLRNGDDIAVLDLGTGAVLGRLKASTKGPRAGLFWKDFGLSVFSGALGGPAVSSGIRGDVAFSSAARRALALGSTGQVLVIDLETGNEVARPNERAAAIAAHPNGSLVFLVSQKRVAVLDVLTNAMVQSLAFPDAPSWPPTRLAVAERRVAIGAGSTLYVLDATSGRTVWSTGGLGRIAHLGFID